MLNSFIYLIIFLILFISIFFIPFSSDIKFENNNNILNSDSLYISNYDFYWPIPGYNKISSPFGKRISPRTGKPSFHHGIDIPAPEGSKFIAIADGEITFTKFLGAGGYTIVLSFNNFKISYCHCSPNFIVHPGDLVKKGDIIGTVGPKYVYNVPGNIYFDGRGYTNGSTTGPHLHFGIRIDNNYQNPLYFYTKKDS